MSETVTITLGGAVYEVERLRLGGFLALTRAQVGLKAASEAGDTGAIVDRVFDYFQIAIPALERAEFNKAVWLEIYVAYQSVYSINMIPGYQDFALLMNQEIGDPARWHYPGRVEHVWVHLLASSYHWSREDILNLWPEIAVAYIQEILADRYEEREWQHRLSEIAYSYDKGSKKMKYVPMPVPLWINAGLGKAVKTKADKTRIHRSVLPVGMIVGDNGKQEIRESVERPDPDEHARGDRVDQDS